MVTNETLWLTSFLRSYFLWICNSGFHLFFAKQIQVDLKTASWKTQSSGTKGLTSRYFMTSEQLQDIPHLSMLIYKPRYIVLD